MRIWQRLTPLGLLLLLLLLPGTTLAPQAQSPVDWQRYTLPGSRLSLESPGPLVPQSLQIPEAYQALIRESVNRQYVGEAPVFLVAAGWTAYVDEVIVSAEGAAEGSFASIRQLDGVTEAQYEPVPDTLDGLAGVRYTGSLTRRGTQLSVEGYALADTPELFTVMVLYETDNPETTAWARRAMESVAIATSDR